MRTQHLPFAAPDLGDAETAAVRDTLRSGWITTGPATHRFEREFSRAVGGTNAVAVNSCTAALHLALEAIGLKEGELVLTTPYAFAASAEVVRYFNAIPVFVDIDPSTFNIDAGQLAEAADALMSDDPHARARWLPPSLVGSGLRVQGSGAALGRVRALLPVHIAGLPADLDAIYAVAAEHGLAVVEDAAHAFPSKYKGRMIGSPIPQSLNPSAPQLACFSFYATKPITTGEGGMITTAHEHLADRCRVMALHGISKDAWRRYSSEGSWYYEIIAPGFKYNMSDLAAAVGVTQLARAEQMWRRRRDIAMRYNEVFSDVPELQTPPDRSDCEHSWHLYALRLHLDRLTIDRAGFIDELRKRRIGTSVHYIPLHLHPYYRETYGYSPEHFPVSHREYLREVSLPIYSRMTDRDVEDVAEAVVHVVNAHSHRA
jgi:dTDP-4-amino-4,6-dideoxygalactose transaminase